MTLSYEILEIIEKNYNTFKGTNEAELHSSFEIAKLFEQRILEFTKWKDENYHFNKRNKWYVNRIDNSIYRTYEQLLNEWNNLNNK
jgi:hypothetical protein